MSIDDMDGEIPDIINEINDRIFLPGLQREFVWDPSQIENFFDSLIREYPVGIITIWKTQSSSIENYTTYNFLESYVASDHYPPKKVQQRFEQYNDEAEVESAEFLIIDGQQRLNSIYIGVCGKITEYTGGAGRKSSEAKNWESKKLSINLFGHPSHEGNEIAGDYQFEFRSTGDLGGEDNSGYEQNDGEHRLWVPVEEFWSGNHDNGYPVDSENLKDEIIDPSISRAPITNEATEDHELDYIAETVGRNLINSILDAELNTKNVKKDRSEIPEIFQRLNKEGERAQRYQLFLSELMTRWPYLKESEKINPRKKIEKWVKRFKRDFPEYDEYIDRKLFIRYSLALINTDLTQSGLDRISSEDFDELRDKWTYTKPTTAIDGCEWFTESLRKSFKTIIDSGIRPGVLDKRPFFVLFGVFYYQNPNATVENNRNKIFQFISKLLLLDQSGYGALNYGKYRKYRRFLFDERSNEDYNKFPGDALLESHNLTLSESDVSSLVTDSRYNDQAGSPTFSNDDVTPILGLIEESYTTVENKDISDYEVDHIYPKSKKDQISESTTQNVDLNKVGNLQLLPQGTNKKKGSKLPAEWFDELQASTERETKKVNQYPDVKLKKENAAEFIEKRDEHIITYLTERYVN